jgi:hypothetical protein
VKYKVLEGKTKIIVPSKKSKTGVLYIPADLVKDSSFPFSPNEEVMIRIVQNMLIIKKEKIIDEKK